MARGLFAGLFHRFLILAGAAALIFGMGPLARAADSLPTPHFVADENWAPDSSVKGAPTPAYTVTPGADGVAVSLPAADAQTSAIITSTRWKVSDPIAVDPTHLELAVSTDAPDLQVSPILVDAEGTDFALTPRTAGKGTLQWDLPADAKKSGKQPSIVLTGDIHIHIIHVGDGKTPIGPVYLKEIQITKAAGAAASIKFSACKVVENPHPSLPMALATDPLWKFDQSEGWVDVNNNEEGRAKFDLTYGPDGTTIIVKPLKRGLTLKLATLTQLGDGQFGHARRIITHIDYDGPANGCVVGLGMKDAEHEVISGNPPITNPPTKDNSLVAGNNDVIWDASNVNTPWRGGKQDGYVDFPVSLDDYTLNVHPSDKTIKIVMRGADVEWWQPLVRGMDVDAGRPRFVWTPGEKVSLSVNVKNIGSAQFNRDIQFSFKDDLEQHEFWNRNVHVTVPANSTGKVAIDFETKGLPQGVYMLNWTSPEITDGIKGLTMITVSDDKPLPKGVEGEFVYGMDMGTRWNVSPMLDWADWCGVDMIRSAARDPYFLSGHIPEYLDAVAECAKHGMRSQMLLWPGTPWDPDKAKFEATIKDSADFAGQLATALKDTNMHWYEIGNEPSLTAFFHGPPADFVKFFVPVRDALKAADPKAIVTVGGLAFAGMAGAEPRATKIVQLMPFDKIDGFGYHGHGEGSKAERWALETEMRRLANAAGKDTKPYYETESGATSTDPASWREQARTVTQKFAYAQSTHIVPAFLWFGFHPNWEWGILQTKQEAKPAALAFRVYVQNARHLIGQNPLSLAGAQGEGYWLKSKDADDKRCMLLLWSDVGQFTRLIDLGKTATNARLMDLFGNTTPCDINADGLVQVNVDENPIYVLVDRPIDAPAPTVLPPALDLPKEVRVIPGTSGALNVFVSNATSAAIDGQITVKPAGGAPVATSQTPVSIPAKGKTAISVPMQIVNQPVDYWPRAWTVFAPVKGDIDVSTFTDIPTSLPSDLKAQPQVGLVDDNVLDLEPLGQGHAERKQAVCFSKINVDSDTDAEVGLAADFWMQFYVNGVNVLDTMTTGNGGGYEILSHVLTIHLKKGENLLAAKVLSGSGGWKLVTGGPQEVASAKRLRAGTIDAAIVELHDGDKMIARESVRLTMLPPLEVRANDAAWSKLSPDATFGHVENIFMKQPDSKKWYHGPADLSGKAWIRSTTDGNLIIGVGVRDDIDMPKDGIIIHLASGDGWKNKLELRSGRDDSVKRSRDEANTMTWYEATIPASVFTVPPREKIAFNVTVEDDDWGEVKQRSSLMPGDDPSTWYQTWRR